MKVVLWIGSGANQKALAHKLSRLCAPEAIVVEHKAAGKRNLSSLLSRTGSRLLFPDISSSWNLLMSSYDQQYPGYPDTKIIHTTSLNDGNIKSLTASINPDLILVSGTSLLREDLLELKPSAGIMNLHTGLSPYMKGGPNCTNWCLATNQLHLIGNTVMWIDKGIDSGNIISSEGTKITGNESLFELHYKVMEHAHDLYCRSVAAAVSKQELGGVRQNSIAKGKTYYRKDWTLKENRALIKNLGQIKQTLASADYQKQLALIKTIPLTS